MYRRPEGVASWRIDSEGLPWDKNVGASLKPAPTGRLRKIPYPAADSIRDTSGRVNSGGSSSPFCSMARAAVPLRVSRSEASWGQVLVLATAPHFLQ